MMRWILPRLDIGARVWLAVALVGLWGCGRDRDNPIDPNFPGNQVLSPPSNVRAVGDIGRIAVTWDAVASSDLAGYGVWRSTSSTGTYRRLTGEVSDSLITTGRTTFVDSTLDLSVSRVYFYRITTINLLRQSSGLSVFVSAEASEDNRPPAAPSDLSAVTDVNTGYVVLNWTAPQSDAGNQALTGLQGYNVFRAKDTEDAFVRIATLPAGQTTYADSSALELDARYFYRVTATDGGENESGRSSSASITTTGTGIASPTGLRTTGKIGEIEVAWNAVSEPSLLGYLVLRSTSTQAAFVPVTGDTLFTTAQTRYLDASVEPGTVYFYRVQAVVQDSDRGLVRSEVSPFVDGEAEVDQSAPAAPSDPIASLDENEVGLVSLSWTAPITDSNGTDLTGLSGFRVFRSRETATSFVLLAELDANQTAYEDRAVDPLTRYYYTISAVDPSGNVGPRSSSVSVVTRGLAVPRNLLAAAGPQRITLTWTANTEPELTGYEVLRYTSPTESEPDARFQTALTTYVDTPLVAGQTYVYRVQALGANGLQSETSTFVSAAPEKLAALLAAPRSVTARADIRQITVSWAANSEVELTGYEVLRYSSPTQTQPDARFPTVLTTYVDSPLVSGQTYVYRVQAQGTGGLLSDVSQFVSATVPLDSRPPAAPGVLSGRLSGDTTIRLTWVAPRTDEGGAVQTGLAQYRIYRSEGSGSAGFQLLATVDSTRLSYDDVGLQSATTYIYRVSALDANGNESAFTSSVSQTTSSTGTIPAPTNVTASVQNDPNLGTIVRVAWTAPAGVTSFRVDRQLAGSSSNSSFETVVPSQADTFFNDTNILAGRTYIYRVISIQGGQTSDPSSLVVVAVP